MQGLLWREKDSKKKREKNPQGFPTLTNSQWWSPGELMYVQPHGHVGQSMPRAGTQCTKEAVFLKPHKEKWKYIRLEGQGSEATPDTLVSAGSNICLGTQGRRSQIPFYPVYPMCYLNRSVTLVARMSPNPSESRLWSNWLIRGLFPEPK